MYANNTAYVEIREQFQDVGSVLLTCRFWTEFRLDDRLSCWPLKSIKI